MIPLGPIVRLQVQPTSLKIGEGKDQFFDPAGIQPVDVLELDDGGVRGWKGETRFADVHHRDHPATKLRGTLNSISFGFTGHYREMRERFGDHLTNGIAGENILIDSPVHWSLDDLGQGVVIARANGSTVILGEVIVADPCAPFTRWSLRFPAGTTPDRTVTEGLQFLSNGMRGYYCRYVGKPVQIEIGDMVFLSDGPAHLAND